MMRRRWRAPSPGSRYQSKNVAAVFAIHPEWGQRYRTALRGKKMLWPV